MKTVGDPLKLRCLWGELPAEGQVLAFAHRKTGEITRKAQVLRIRGQTVHLVIVPLDVPHNDVWVRATREESKAKRPR